MGSAARNARFDGTAMGAPTEPEAAGSWIETETVLPAQFVRNARAACATGERRLMAAVLGDAIGLYLKYAGYERGRGAWLFAEANRWFQSRDRSWPFSFELICEAFDFDPQEIRRRLLQHASGRERTGRIDPAIELRRAPVVRRGSVRLRSRTTAAPA